MHLSAQIGYFLGVSFSIIVFVIVTLATLT